MYVGSFARPVICSGRRSFFPPRVAVEEVFYRESPPSSFQLCSSRERAFAGMVYRLPDWTSCCLTVSVCLMARGFSAKERGCRRGGGRRLIAVLKGLRSCDDHINFGEHLCFATPPVRFCDEFCGYHMSLFVGLLDTVCHMSLFVGLLDTACLGRSIIHEHEWEESYRQCSPARPQCLVQSIVLVGIAGK